MMLDNQAELIYGGVLGVLGVSGKRNWRLSVGFTEIWGAFLGFLRFAPRVFSNTKPCKPRKP